MKELLIYNRVVVVMIKMYVKYKQVYILYFKHANIIKLILYDQKAMNESLDNFPWK